MRSYINCRFFVVASLLIKPKQQHGKNQNKNTGLFINWMDFVAVRTKINQSGFGFGSTENGFFLIQCLSNCQI
jgi:hypothetical protein